MTKVKAKQPLTGATNRVIEDKLNEIVSILDFGALCDGVSNDSAIINTALSVVSARAGGGFVVIPPNTIYIEGSLTIPSNVTIIDYSTAGVVRYLTADAGTPLPVTIGGVGVKSKGKAEVLLRAHDSGVAALPFLQLLRRDTGQLAGLNADFLSLVGAAAGGFIEGQEISTPTAPTANGWRLFSQDNGAGKTQLCVIFNTGAVQVIATQP